MAIQQLPPEVISQLNTFVNNKDYASFYSTLAQYGHDYGNLAYAASTNTGFYGIYANNYLNQFLGTQYLIIRPYLRTIAPELLVRQGKTTAFVAPYRFPISSRSGILTLLFQRSRQGAGHDQRYKNHP